jgi:nucleotide-binding universal stress UspA family protein
VYRSLLLPTDGSEAAEAGLQEGLRLAKALKARVAFLYALEPLGPKLLLGPETLPYYRELVEDLRREGLAALDRATRMAEELTVPFEAHLLEGRAAEVILKEAEKHDLIVMGTHGRTGLDRLLLGKRGPGGGPEKPQARPPGASPQDKPIGHGQEVEKKHRPVVVGEDP